MGYFCRKCKKYYELPEGESASDYVCSSCDGSLGYVESLDLLNSMTWMDDIKGEEVFDIVECEDPKMSVIAGPGTGKSFALKRRVQRLLEEGKNPSRMLVVTFSRTAASDIKNELLELEVEGTERIITRTLHSFCFSVLNREGVLDSIGRDTRTLLDFEKRFMLQDLSELGLGQIRPLDKKLKAFEAAWARLQSDEPGWPEEDDLEFEEKLYEWLGFHDAMIIEEIVKETYEYLRDNPSSEELERFDYIFVDEYQDLNKAEQRLIDLLASNGASVMIIGDDDQSIFETMRHAHPEGIREYTDETCDGNYKSLNKCWRCPEKVINLSQAVISHNNIRYFPKYLQPTPKEHEGEISIVQWNSLDEEVEGIVKFIKKKINDESVDMSEILVLAPRNLIGYMISDKLNEIGIKAQSFFTEKELKEGDVSKNEKSQHKKAFTLLTLLAYPEDKVALRCWLGFGSQGLKARSYRNLLNYCYTENETPKTAIEQVINGDIKIPNIHYIIRSYEELNERINELNCLKGSKLIDEIFPVEESWAEPFRKILMDFDEKSSPLEIYEELKTRILQPELPTDVDYVRVMSLYKSKGLTADMVIMCSCIERLMPFSKPDLSDEEHQIQLEEQRRLFYVGLTRTRNTLVISSYSRLPSHLAHDFFSSAIIKTRRGNFYSRASPFIRELGPDAPRAIRGSEWISNMQQM